MDIDPTREHLLSDIESLRSRLEKAEKALKLICDVETNMISLERTEEAVEDSAVKYRIVADNAYDWESWQHPDGRFLYISPSCQRITGYGPAEFEADHTLLTRLVHPDDRVHYESHLHKTHRAKMPGEMEYRILDDAGRTRWIGHVCQPIFDERNGFLGTRCTDRDISERKVMETQLRDSRERFKQILEGIADAYVAFDRNWRFVEVNPAAERLVYERPAHELLGKIIWEEYPHAVGAEFYHQYHAAVAERRPVHFESKSVIVEGKWFEIHAYPRDGLLEAYVKDITERKKMEEELRRSRDEMERRVEERTHDLLKASELLEDVFSNMPIHVAYLDRNLNFIRVNKRYAEATGHEPGFLAGKNLFRLFPDQADEAVFRKVVETGEPYRVFEKPVVYPGGPARGVAYWDWTLDPLKDEEGGVDGLIFTAIDRTAHVTAQEQVRKASHIIENAGFGIAVIDPVTNTFDFVNPAYGRLHGYGHDEMLGMGAKDVYIPEARNTLRRFTREIDAKGHVTFESVHIRKDGSTFPVLVNDVLVRGKEGKPLYMVSFVEDITRLKHSEKELRLLAAVIEQSSENVIIADKDGVIEYVNPRFEEHTGYSSSEIIGRKLASLKSGRHDDASFRSIRNAVAKGVVWAGRTVRKKKDGTTYETDTAVSPVRDRFGHTMNTVVVERDVTEQIKLERQVRQAQKMEAIGTLAGGIAHDFNNIIAGIIGFTEMALEDTEMGTPIHRRLSLVLKGAHRGRDLVKQILSFGRASEQEKKPLRMSPLLDEAIKFLRASIPATVEIKKNFSARWDVVLADRTEIHQVVLNLCTNAAQAMREKAGLLEIVLADAVLTDIDCRPYRDIKPGPFVRLTVRDTGSGMDAETLECIFDPFFTTKKPGEGTGLGLSVVHGIVKRHEGLITVESVPGEGSAFHVFFPKLGEDHVPESLQKAELAKGKGRILFVDDEELLVEMNQGRLEGLGYQVVGKKSPLEALALFRKNPQDFDLVITDYTMPQMTGIGLARELLALRPDIPVILCSGLNELIAPEEVAIAGIKEFLPKAVGKRELVKAVQNLLEKKE